MRRALANILHGLAWHLVRWSGALKGQKITEMVVSTDWKEID